MLQAILPEGIHYPQHLPALQGQEPKTYKTGEVFHNAAKIVHDAKNTSTTGPSKVLVFLIAEKGQPLASPAQ
jgi:quercetin dioxygenase-like cupin family protein